MSKIDQINDLKKIRAIKTKYGLSPYIETEMEKLIIDEINQPQAILEKRIRGLEMEDEFLLLLLMTADLEQVTKLEQKQYVNNKKYTVPDFLLGIIVPEILNKSKVPKIQRMFVEVKKCKDSELVFNIAKLAYQKLRFYSQLYTLPLYFAIKFNTKHIKQWFLISGKALEQFSNKVNKKIHGRNQDCYSIDVTEMVKRDFSGLWLNNFTILLRKGTVITKIYDKNILKANIVDEKLGALVSHKIQLEKNEFEKKLVNSELFMESAIFSTLLKTLARGKINRKKENNKTITTYTADNNYSIPYYWLISETFLHLRVQFQKILKEPDRSIEFYINNFSDLERNLIVHIKNVCYRLIDNKLIQPIRIVPNLH